jgi:hypothetical protein
MGKDLSRYQEGIVKRYYEHHETIQSNKLSDLVAELWLAEDEKAKAKLWGRAQVALMRMGVDATQAAKVVGERDLAQFAKLVGQVDAGRVPAAGGQANTTSGDAPAQARGAKSLSDGRTIAEARAQKAAASGFDSLDEENLKRAMKAFRQKLKTLKRDDESKLGGRYVTRGQASNICAITPPAQYPAAVWNKLAESGRLKRAGGGTFALP